MAVAHLYRRGRESGVNGESLAGGEERAGIRGTLQMAYPFGPRNVKPEYRSKQGL